METGKNAAKEAVKKKVKKVAGKILQKNHVFGWICPVCGAGLSPRAIICPESLRTWHFKLAVSGKIKDEDQKLNINESSQDISLQ